jgi:hypothetical protein
MVPPSVTLTGATTVGLWAAIVGVLGIFVRQIVPWRKQDSDAEARFRDTLIKRIERLERQQIRVDAEKRLLIHKLRNVTACFDAMLMMLEMNPDRGPEIVAKIKEQRAAQMLAEAEEAAIISAAAIEAEDPQNTLTAGEK